MRGSKHADEEIRQLAIAILKKLQADSANLFGDYQLDEFEPGKFQIVTKFNKV